MITKGLVSISGSNIEDLIKSLKIDFTNNEMLFNVIKSKGIRYLRFQVITLSGGAVKIHIGPKDSVSSFASVVELSATNPIFQIQDFEDENLLSFFRFFKISEAVGSANISVILITND